MEFATTKEPIRVPEIQVVVQTNALLSIFPLRAVMALAHARQFARADSRAGGGSNDFLSIGLSRIFVYCCLACFAL